MIIKLNGKRLYSTETVKYLSVKIGENLTRQHQINDLSIELNRASALLFTMKKFIDSNILSSIYFAIFESSLHNCRPSKTSVHLPCTYEINKIKEKKYT